jgi:hypothetical protein
MGQQIVKALLGKELVGQFLHFEAEDNASIFCLFL